MHPLAAPRAARATTIAARAIAAGALGILLVALGPACRLAERTERPLRLSVATVPPGAPVSVSVAKGEVRALGKAPVEISGLSIVRKRYASGVFDYWLADAGGALPPNPGKPSYASPDYAAGNDYPLALTFSASYAGGEEARPLTIDRALLAKLYAEPAPAIQLMIPLGPALPPARPRGKSKRTMPRNIRLRKRKAHGGRPCPRP